MRVSVPSATAAVATGALPASTPPYRFGCASRRQAGSGGVRHRGWTAGDATGAAGLGSRAAASAAGGLEQSDGGFDAEEDGRFCRGASASDDSRSDRGLVPSV